MLNLSLKFFIFKKKVICLIALCYNKFIDNNEVWKNSSFQAIHYNYLCTVVCNIFQVTFNIKHFFGWREFLLKPHLIMWSQNMGTLLVTIDLSPVSPPYCRQLKVWLNTRKEFNIEKKINRKTSKTSVIVLAMIDIFAQRSSASDFVIWAMIFASLTTMEESLDTQLTELSGWVRG